MEATRGKSLGHSRPAPWRAAVRGFAAGFAFWLGATVAPAAEVVVGGSDLLQPWLAKTVGEFNRDNPRPLALRLTGTLTAIADVRAGRVPLALVAVKPDAAPFADGLRAVPLAYQTVVFAVPAGSPVKQINYAQLAGIFGEGTAAAARRWADLGFTGDWSAKAIAPHSLVAPHSLSLELFRQGVLRAPELRSTIVAHSALAEFEERFAADDGAIALLSAPPRGAVRLALLPVARTAQDTAFGPTPENIHAGDYPLRLPFVLLFKAERSAEIFEAARFLLSEEVAAALEAGGLVPVPREARNQALFELEARH